MDGSDAGFAVKGCVMHACGLAYFSPMPGGCLSGHGRSPCRAQRQSRNMLRRKAPCLFFEVGPDRSNSAVIIRCYSYILTCGHVSIAAVIKWQRMPDGGCAVPALRKQRSEH